jgi:hypothetical protein
MMMITGGEEWEHGKRRRGWKEEETGYGDDGGFGV